MKAGTRRRIVERKIVERLLRGDGTNVIARELHVSKERAIRVREMAREYGYLDRSRPLPPYPEAVFPDFVDKRTLKVSEPEKLLREYQTWIQERLGLGWYPVTVYEELPVKVSRSSFYRFICRHSLGHSGRAYRRVIPEIVHRPGEALLLDWGKLRSVTVQNKRKTLWAFVGVLGFSRYLMVRLVWSNDTETTLTAISSMFDELGGVPDRITSDNPKCFALEASRYEPLLNPAFERFASYYGTLIECLPPADPEKKGKVERPMPYVRRLYQAHGEAWHGIDESQEYLTRKVAIANERRHGTTNERPIERFTQTEALALKPLPSLPYQIEEYHCGTVRRDGHVRFRGKYYSLDETFIGKEVTILGNSENVSIYHAGQLLEVHPRVKDPLRSKSTKPQHLKPWERTLEQDSLYRHRARRLGPAVEEIITAILRQGQGFIDYRRIWGILSLDKTFSAESINAACQKALELNSLRYRAIRHLLETNSSPTAQPARQAGQANKFLHPIEAYKEHIRLTIINGGKHERGNNLATAPVSETANSGKGVA